MPDYFGDNYNDEPDSGNPEPAPADDNQPASQVALLPMDFFGGKDLQPGGTCTVKIVKVLDDQVQVSYVGEEGGSSSDDLMS